MLSIWTVLGVLVVILFLRFVFFTILPYLAQYRKCQKAVAEIDCEKPHWFFGHLLMMSTDEAGLHYAAGLTKNYPKCNKMWYGPSTLFLSCHHPDLTKTVLVADLPKDEVAYRFLRPWIGDGLVTSSGKKWKRNRRLLMPAFHAELLKEYIAHHNEATLEMMNKWSDETCSESINVEMFHDVSRMALDNLLRCIFSVTFANMLPESQRYLDAEDIIRETTVLRFYKPWLMLDFIFYRTDIGRQYTQSLKVVHDFAEKAIRERKSSNRSGTVDKKPDLLDVLFGAKDSEGVGLSDREIRDEVDTFIFAGHDTLTSGISWAFHNLAIYPEFQEKCRDEVISILGGKSMIEWEHITKFSYLTMFIKESLRLFPPATIVSRKIREPLFFPRGFGPDQYNTESQPNSESSRTLPEESNIQVHIFMTHRNPSLWEDPEKFDPERFMPEKVRARSPHVYLPFSAGPRNCIGQNFAMNLMKVVLALALTRYRFEVDESHPKPERLPYITLRSKTGIHIKVIKI